MWCLHNDKETLERPSGVLATATALLVTYINFVFRLQSLKCFLIFFLIKDFLHCTPYVLHGHFSNWQLYTVLSQWRFVNISVIASYRALLAFTLQAIYYIVAKLVSFQDAICLKGITSRYQTELPHVFVVSPIQVTTHWSAREDPSWIAGTFRLRDVIAEVLDKCLPEVSTEPTPLAVTGESLPRGTTLEPGARLNILARGFYSPMERAFLMSGFHAPELLPTVFTRPLLRCMLPMRSNN